MTYALTNYPREELLVFDVSWNSVSMKQPKNSLSPANVVTDEVLEVKRYSLSRVFI